MIENDLSYLDGLSFINEEFQALEVLPGQLDSLLANGWRHFGTHFFRYSFGFYQNRIRHVNPLRIKLADYSMSKSHRRIVRKNKDLQTTIRPTEITAEKEELFDRHKSRFGHGKPNSLFDFLSFSPSNVPTDGWEVCVYDRTKLLAASFFDVGENSVSGIYAMFDPRENTRSLGIFTMLLEIEYSIERNKTFYYQGYAYEGESFYDYKKRFTAIEKFDWKGNWTDFRK